MRTNFFKIASFFLLSVYGGLVFGQDIHFSQFYSSPLTLNPSLTGSASEKYRITANYRNQWSSLSPFVTYSLGYDMSILQNKLKNDIAGIGIIAVNDEVTNGGIKNLNAMVTGAYHKALGKKNNHYLAAGFQAGVVQRSFNSSELLFPNQWSPSTGATSNIPNGENFESTSAFYFDLSAGLLWYTFIGKRSNVFLGGSVFHVHEPKISFLAGENKHSRRYLIHGGGKFAASSTINIVPNMLYMLQNQQQEINLGSSFEFDFEKANSTFAVGGWYRFDDAVIAATSFQYKSYKLGFSYDINISDLKAVTNQQGGFEISLVIGIPGGASVDAKTHPGPKI